MGSYILNNIKHGMGSWHSIALSDAWARLAHRFLAGLWAC